MIEFEIGYGIDVDPVVTQVLDIEFGIGVGISTEIITTRLIPLLDFGIGIAPYPYYTGPGTGIVVGGRKPLKDRVRDGDSFPILYRWAGIYGMSAIANVISRTATSDRNSQELETHPVFPDDPTIFAPLQRGERPIVRPPEANSMTRRLIRESDERQKQERLQRHENQT